MDPNAKTGLFAGLSTATVLIVAAIAIPILVCCGGIAVVAVLGQRASGS